MPPAAVTLPFTTGVDDRIGWVHCERFESHSVPQAGLEPAA